MLNRQVRCLFSKIRYKGRIPGLIEYDSSYLNNLYKSGLTYDTSVHFPESFLAQTGIRSTMQLAKYPRVLYAKPSSKMFTF